MNDDLSLIERVEALEKRDIELSDLPVRALQDRLEADWRPSAAVLLGGDSITLDMLGSAIAHGKVTVTWPGGSPNATQQLINHGLPHVPTEGQATPDIVGPWSSGHVGTFTAQQFTLAVRTFDGTSPALGTTQIYYWEVK